MNATDNVMIHDIRNTKVVITIIDRVVIQKEIIDVIVALEVIVKVVQYTADIIHHKVKASVTMPMLHIFNNNNIMKIFGAPIHMHMLNGTNTTLEVVNYKLPLQQLPKNVPENPVENLYIPVAVHQRIPRGMSSHFQCHIASPYFSMQCVIISVTCVYYRLT